MEKNIEFIKSKSKEGAILIHVPIGQDVNYCESNNLMFSGEKPKWTSFSVDKANRFSFNNILKHSKYLKQFMNLDTDKIIKERLSSRDSRIFNLFMARQQGTSFFEVNMAGLSVYSIEKIFQFVLSELNQDNNKLLYVLIEPNITFDPIVLKKKDVTKIINQIYN